METSPQSPSLLQRLHTAQNQHDLDAFINCFDPDYVSEQPVHPERAFHGREQARKNWSAFFSSMPDFRSEVLRAATGNDILWAEWRWSGTRADGTRLEMRGVTVFGIREDLIVWGRLYMESVEQTSIGIDEVVRSLTHETPQGE
jgi:ketosteroid isomerase-like protein